MIIECEDCRRKLKANGVKQKRCLPCSILKRRIQIKSYGIRNKKGEQEKKCLECKEIFFTNDGRRKYCTPECSKKKETRQINQNWLKDKSKKKISLFSYMSNDTPNQYQYYLKKYRGNLA